MKFKIHDALNEYEIEIHIKMYVFIIIMNIENHLSLVPLCLVCLSSKVNWEQEGKNPAWQGEGVIS